MQNTGRNSTTIGTTLNNSGSLIVQSGSLSLTGPFYNTGTVNVQNGSLLLSGSAPITGSYLIQQSGLVSLSGT